MADPVVYGPAFSTYTRSVLLALEEKGVAYRLEPIDIFSGENKTPEHLARHPFAKVPALEHDGVALFEAQAIMHYVDATFDGPGLTPAGAADQARMIQGLCIVDSYAYPSMITDIVIQRLVVPKLGGETDEAVVAAAVPLAETAARALDAMVGDGGYLAGGAVSLADLHLVPLIEYLSATPEGERILDATPNLGRWWDGMSGRPSVIQTQPSLG